jgi:dipeptidase
MFVIAGKRATADGSVLMGYNNDWAANNYCYLKKVPATPTAYGYTRIMTLGKVREGGMNERGLAVCYGAATDLAPAVVAADPYVNKGVGQYMWDALLERCSTAREAIDYLERCARTTGFSIWAAGSFGIADGDEAWVFELLGGHHWVAARVPDNAYYAQPNMVRIRRVDLGDPANFRGSPDLASFARGLGLYDPADGPLDVAWAYGDRADLTSYYNTNRLWGVTKRWSPSLASDPTMPYAERPVFAVPDRPLSRTDIIAFNREHYEGTELDQTGGYTFMSPHSQTDRPICCSYTDYGAVFQCRGRLPRGIGGILWLAPSRPCSSAFVPFYCSITSVPAAWTDHAAYEAFSGVAGSLDKKGTVDGELRYKHYIGLVRATFGAFDADTATRQVDLERNAARMWTKDKAGAIRLLTTFSSERATTAYDLAKGLPGQMP